MKSLRRLLLSGAVAASMISAMPLTAHAGPVKSLRPLGCVLSGSISTSPGLVPGTTDWVMFGVGTCLGIPVTDVFTAVFGGKGTSTGLGLCDGLLVTNLDINVKLEVTNWRTGEVTSSLEHWSAPVTTYPLVMPFLSDNAGTLDGVGVVKRGIHCLPKGSNQAQVVWVLTHR